MDEQPSTIIIEVKTMDGKILGTIPATFRTFSTGSQGYYANGKVGQGILGEKGLQCSMNLVLIGTKPKDAKKKKGE